MSGKKAHHGGHHGGRKGGHSKGKKIMPMVGGERGMSAGAGKHLNHTGACSPGACGPNDYFGGTNESMYKGGSDGD